jgi:hypothetical protein
MIIGPVRKQNSKLCHTMLHIVSYSIEKLPVRALVKANRVNIQPKIGYPKNRMCLFKMSQGKSVVLFSRW